MVKNSNYINKDIKKNIFKYLRKKPKHICNRCKKICMWNKKICSFIKLKNGDVSCIECYPYPIVCII